MARAAVDVSTRFGQENTDLEDGLSLQRTHGLCEGLSPRIYKEVMTCPIFVGSI